MISTITFSVVLIGWSGADSLYVTAYGQALPSPWAADLLKRCTAACFMFVGPLLLILATISERIVGNLGYFLFAVFWLSFGFLQLPTPWMAAANPPQAPIR